MNLQQLRYLVATADEGTMTRAAESLHVAQPALSRAVRALEAEIGVTVFERAGRGVHVTREGREVVALTRRILSDVQRLTTLRDTGELRVCAPRGQAREIGAPAVARCLAGGMGPVALDVVETTDEALAKVRDGSALLAVVELPAPHDVEVVSLGWQEIVLIHPADWSLDDPVCTEALAELPLLSPGADDWRRDTIEHHLRMAGIDPVIAAEANDRDLLVQLVQAGAGAWFSYGRQAAAAVAGGAGMVHLSPPPMREVGVVHLGEADGHVTAFVEAARAAAAEVLIPVGDPRLEQGTWIGGGDALGPVPPTSVRRPTPD